MRSYGVSSATEQGSRPYQEDRFLEKVFPASHPRNAFLAVMDGHGGSEVSSFCERELWDLFRTCREIDPIEKMRHLFALAGWHTNATTTVGSTLSVAWVRQNHCNEVVVGTLGDSPVIVVDHAGSVMVSPEHNVINPVEREGVIARGAIRCDVHYHYNSSNAGLQLTRALGDAEFGEVISRAPEIYTVEDPQYVIVASDGVFDCGHRKTHERIEEMLCHLTVDTKAEDIMGWAKARGFADNATVLLWNSHQSRRCRN